MGWDNQYDVPLYWIVYTVSVGLSDSKLETFNAGRVLARFPAISRVVVSFNSQAKRHSACKPPSIRQNLETSLLKDQSVLQL